MILFIVRVSVDVRMFDSFRFFNFFVETENYSVSTGLLIYPLLDLAVSFTTLPYCTRVFSFSPWRIKIGSTGSSQFLNDTRLKNEKLMENSATSSIGDEEDQFLGKLMDARYFPLIGIDEKSIKL